MIKSNLRVFLLLFLAGFALYSNVIPGEFLFDDNLFIENNEQIKSLSNIPKLYYSSVTEGSSVSADNFYRPNQQVVNSLLYYFFGLNPIPFHITSILFHVINGFLIFLLFLKLGLNRIPSFCGSLLFIIHPINTQAVSYISGMADPMGLMFVLSALHCFILVCNETGKQNIFWGFIGSIFFFFLGLFTKENTVVFPALALIILIFITYSKEGKFTGNLIRNNKAILLTGIFFLISLVYLYFKFNILNFAGGIGLSGQDNIYTQNLYIRLITFINVLPEYFRMIFFPLRLNYEKPYLAFVDFQRVESIIGLIGIFVWAGLSAYPFFRKNNTKKQYTLTTLALPFSFVWFIICISPVSGIIPVNAIYLEHWLYFPIIGIIFFFVALFEKRTPFVKNVLLILFVIFCMGFSARTMIRNSEWADGIKFYKNELKYAGNSARMHNNIAMIYAGMQKCPLAIQHYKKAISLYDVYPQTHHNLGRCYEALGNTREATQEYFNALLLYPGFTYSHKTLFNIFQNEGDTATATLFYNFILRIQNGQNINRDEITEVIKNRKK